MPPKLNPQTPGQAPQTAGATTQTGQGDAADPSLLQGDAAGAGNPGSASDEETVLVSKADLSALMARIQALESRPRQAASSGKVAEESLPDQSEISVTKIQRPVLTKQGWVVPAKFGSNPAAKAL